MENGNIIVLSWGKKPTDLSLAYFRTDLKFYFLDKPYKNQKDADKDGLYLISEMNKKEEIIKIQKEKANNKIYSKFKNIIIIYWGKNPTDISITYDCIDCKLQYMSCKKLCKNQEEGDLLAKNTLFEEVLKEEIQEAQEELNINKYILH